MLSFFMHGHIVPLQIFVGGTDVRESCLVTSNHDTFSIGQISDAGILQTIELVGIRPFESSTYLVEHVPIYTGRVLDVRGLEILTKQVVMVRLVEHLQVEHCLDDLVVQAYHAVSSVLGYTRGYKHLLLAQIDVFELDVGDFIGADEGVVGELAK